MAKQTTLAERPTTDAGSPKSAEKKIKLGKPAATTGSRRGRSRLWVAVVACLMLAVVGVGELARMVRTGQAPQRLDTVTLSGVKLHLSKVAWVDFDHEDTGGGFAMPPQMMPDMPAEGFVRLRVDATLENVGGGAARTLDPVSEFFLGGGTLGSEPIDLQADTFGQLSRVNPQTAVNGALFFDLPRQDDGADPLFLEWRRAGETTRLQLDPGGEAPDHGGH